MENESYPDTTANLISQISTLEKSMITVDFIPEKEFEAVFLGGDVTFENELDFIRKTCVLDVILSRESILSLNKVYSNMLSACRMLDILSMEF